MSGTETSLRTLEKARSVLTSQAEVAASFRDQEGQNHPAIAFVQDNGLHLFTPHDGELFMYRGFWASDSIPQSEDDTSPAFSCLVRPSCFHCKNVEGWDTHGTREDPPDSGWGCSTMPQKEYLSLMDTVPEDVETEAQQAECMGSNCRMYQFFDWKDFFADQAEALAAENYEVGLLDIPSLQ